MESGLLSLKWNNHSATFLHVLANIRCKPHDSFSDVTLACDGKFYPVHKLVLSSCSDYFEQIFSNTQCKQPVIVLKDIKVSELEALLNYMYCGEVSVLQADLAGLIKAAECLKIKGLAVPDEAPSPAPSSSASRSANRDREHRDSPNKRSASSRDFTQHSKRQRHDDEGEYHHRDASSSSSSVREERDNLRHNISADGVQSSQDNDSRSQREKGGKEKLPDTVNNNAAPMSSPSQSLDVIVEDEEPTVKQEILDEPKEEDDDNDNVFNSYDSLNAGLQGDGVSEGGQSFDQIMSSQPQTMEDLVAQSMPGTSGMQGDMNWSNQGGGDMSRFSLDAFQVDDSQGSGGSQQQPMGRGDDFRPFRSTRVAKLPRFSQGSTCETMHHQEFNHGIREGILMTDPTGTSLGNIHHCPVCNKGFAFPKDLKRHHRIHTGEKPFACHVCNFRTAVKGNLKRHVLHQHM